MACMSDLLPNSTHAFDQMLNNMTNITELELRVNFICNTDIKGNVMHFFHIVDQNQKFKEKKSFYEEFIDLADDLPCSYIKIKCS